MTKDEALAIQKEVYKSYKQRNKLDPHGFDPNLPTFWLILELDRIGYINRPHNKVVEDGQADCIFHKGYCGHRIHYGCDGKCSNYTPAT